MQQLRHVLPWLQNHKNFLPKYPYISPFSLFTAAPCTALSPSRIHPWICYFSDSFFICWFALIPPSHSTKPAVARPGHGGRPLNSALTRPSVQLLPPDRKCPTSIPRKEPGLSAFSQRIYPINISPDLSAGGSRTRLLSRLSFQALAVVQPLWYTRRHQWVPLKKKTLCWTERSGSVYQWRSVLSGKSGILVNQHISHRKHSSSPLQIVFIIWHVEVQSVLNMRIKMVKFIWFCS